MYLRCNRCHEPTWIRSLVPGLVERTVACQDCGQEHELDRVSELGETAKQQYDKANEFAAANDVDLPTAYSVLLGLMPLSDARDADTEKKSLNRREAATKATPDLPPEPVAVRPPRGGARRRQPRASAPRKPSRAGEPENESTVTIHVEREMAEHRKRLTWGQAVLLIILAVLTLGLSGRHAYLTWRGMVDEARNATKSTEASERALENARLKADEKARESNVIAEELHPTVERDARGRVTRVVGADPMRVLEAYCEAVSDIHPREPLELAEASPPSPAERYGVFLDFSQLQANRAIRISRVDGMNRWETGNGRLPVPTREAPDSLKTIRRVSEARRN